MVPMTIDLEGRDGAMDPVMLSSGEMESSSSWFDESWSRFLESSLRVTATVVVAVEVSLRSSLKEVLRRFLMGVVWLVATAAEGKMQGRKNRRRASTLVMVELRGVINGGFR